MRKIIIAVDGYSSCGKSTIAKALAAHTGYIYVDTGAMYRAYALALMRGEKDITLRFNEQNHICLNGEDVEGLIRTLEVGNKASQVSTRKEVRDFLVAQQREMGKAKGIVMDGRDIGTVVFPDAEFKLFLTATPEVRAFRRYRELRQKGDTSMTMEQVMADVNDRDYRDTHRSESPLRQAEDAFLLDNSYMCLDEQYELLFKMVDIIRSNDC